jgi:5-(carboxyamino)imidazole ribonucleotide mutase
MNKIRVAIITGSDSDLPVVAETVKVLNEFGVPFRINVASAHRTPDKVRACVREAEDQGAEVFIASAGMAAALPGVVAAETTFPVIGVPMEGKFLNGLDALLSIVQMPTAIPVATVAVGKAGAMNAGLLAVEMLAMKDAALKEKLGAYRRKIAASVNEKDKKLQEMGIEKYIESTKK